MIHLEQFEDVRGADASRCPFSNVSISLVHNFEREDVSLSCRNGHSGIVVVPAVGLAREQTDQKRTLSGVDRCRVRRETGGVFYKLICDSGTPSQQGQTYLRAASVDIASQRLER